MISGCLANKMNVKNYIKMNHPYQKLIRKHLEYFTNKEITSKQKGVDGCSAPQYSFPMKNLSISMIKLIKSLYEDNAYSYEIRLLLSAISKYPFLTGSKIKYDSQLIKATKGKFFSKWGAEGVLLFAHKEKKIGGVIKVEDGNARALPSVANEIFKKLHLIDSKELKELSHWSNEKLLNHANKTTGKIYTKII